MYKFTNARCWGRKKPRKPPFFRLHVASNGRLVENWGDAFPTKNRLVDPLRSINVPAWVANFDPYIYIYTYIIYIYIHIYIYTYIYIYIYIYNHIMIIYDHSWMFPDFFGSPQSSSMKSEVPSRSSARLGYPHDELETSISYNGTWRAKAGISPEQYGNQGIWKYYMKILDHTNHFWTTSKSWHFVRLKGCRV